MNRQSIYIVCEKRSKRLDYILDVVFDLHLGMEYFVIDQEKDAPDKAPVISYGIASINSNAVSLYRHPLLFEENIYAQAIHVDRDEDGLPYFFAAYDFKGDYYFDIFSMIFYMLSRYEEYLHFKPDEFGRYSAKYCLAYREKFLHLPVVDIWILKLKSLLEAKNEIDISLNRSYEIKPTIDIDTPYAFIAKPWWLQLGVLSRDIVLWRPSRFKNRLSALFGATQDCFDSFDYLKKQFDLYNLKPVCFFLMRLHLPDDQNFSIGTKNFNALVRQIREYAECGLHPSLFAKDKPDEVMKEKSQLESITDKSIVSSRQHFLYLSLPKTYRIMTDIGLKHDYSMGFHDANGFRAGTCVSFPWYDLKAESKSNLWIHPFQIMDVTLQKYESLNIEDAKLSIQAIKREVKKVQGTFAFIWHNSSFAEQYGWQGWDQVFEGCLMSNDDSIVV